MGWNWIALLSSLRQGHFFRCTSDRLFATDEHVNTPFTIFTYFHPPRAVTWDPTCSDKHCDLQVGLRLSPLDVWTHFMAKSPFPADPHGSADSNMATPRTNRTLFIGRFSAWALDACILFWTGAKKKLLECTHDWLRVSPRGQLTRGLLAPK